MEWTTPRKREQQRPNCYLSIKTSKLLQDFTSFKKYLFTFRGPAQSILCFAIYCLGFSHANFSKPMTPNTSGS